MNITEFLALGTVRKTNIIITKNQYAINVLYQMANCNIYQGF